MRQFRERSSSSALIVFVCPLSFKSTGELPSKVAATVHRGGIRLSFDGYNSNTCHRRKTVVEGFNSPQVSERTREGMAHQKSTVNGVEGNCGEMLKEPNGTACSVATRLPPGPAERRHPRTGRRGTEIL